MQLSARARQRLTQARTDQWWAQDETTTVVSDPAGKTLWWTFAGWKANLWLAAIATAAGLRNSTNQLDDLAISLDLNTDPDALRAALHHADPAELALAPWITAEAIEGLKFAECLPIGRATQLVARRLADHTAVVVVQGERLDSVALASG